MKYHFKNKLIIAGAFLLATSSCNKFDTINTDPLAASADQVQVEYFINNSIVGAQQDPHIAERVFILFWKNAGRHQLGGGIINGVSDDGWSSDYWRYISGWLNAANTGIQIGEEQIEKGTNKLYTSNLIQVARIWRAYLNSELTDNFGPIAIDAFKGVNPEYVDVKETYYYMLNELKDAAAKMDVSVESPGVLNKSNVTFSYKYNWAKWQKYANSLRMRLAMRIAEVDAAVAKQHFEEAAAGSNFIKDAADIFDVQQNPANSWDNLTPVMSREWNSQWLSPTLNNLYTNLGDITSESQVPTEIQSYVKPANYIGLDFRNYHPTKTNDPTIGFYLDGLPKYMDPRAYKAFIIPGWYDNANFCAFPSWDNTSKTTVRSVLAPNDDVLKTMDAKFTWNAWGPGVWGTKTHFRQFRSNNGPTPRIAQNFRTNATRRVFFASWESYFLVAEAAVKGWTVPMTGKAAYEEGIKASFAYFGVSSNLGSYLTSTNFNRVGTSVAWDHTTEPGNTYSMNYNDGMTGAAGTVEMKYAVNNLYKNGTVRNDQLTKIITQKYLAQVPWLPLEAWNDHRRLGLPFFENPVVEDPIEGLPDLTSSTYMNSSIKFFPQRLKYPTSLKAGSPEGYAKAVSLLGGEDDELTPLWWAKKQ